MKSIALFSIMCLLMMNTTAQEIRGGLLLSGTVIYEQTIPLDIQLDGDASQFAHALPKEQKSQKILHFTEDAALYENHQKEEASVEPEESGMQIRIAEPENRIYTNLKEGQCLEQKEFMSRLFLIESERREGKWKTTGGQKYILDYPCMEAVAAVDGKEVKAWFTPKIAISAGPDSFSGLPGLILAVDIDEGSRSIEAISVELGPVDETSLEKPRKGKKVSRKEYQAIVDAKMQEMGIEEGQGVGGNRTVVIKISQ